MSKEPKVQRGKIDRLGGSFQKDGRTITVKPYMGRLSKFGRRTVIDPKDQQYRMRLGLLQTVRTFKYHMALGQPLDQGSTSQCVAYAWTKFLTAHPIVNKPKLTPAQLYKRAQQLDEWLGEEPAYEGTSVRAGAKALVETGQIVEYRWGRTAEEVVQQLIHSPVVLGTDWHRGMSMVSRDGFIHPQGPIDGGHAYLAIGFSREKKDPSLSDDDPRNQLGAIRILNSWGRNWGQNGRAWLLIADLEKLIQAYGEACVATELKVA